MKRLILISVLYSLTLNGMSTNPETESPEALAQKVESIIDIADVHQTELAIKCIKQILKDDNLRSDRSLLVKEKLVSVLSTKITQSLRASIPESNTQEIIRTVFYDGTISLEKKEYILQLDKECIEVLFPKPNSPWHNLSFEDFIKQYYLVHSSYK